MPYAAAHDYGTGRLAAMIGDRTRLIATAHVDHVYGNDMNEHRLCEPSPNIPICLPRRGRHVALAAVA